MTVLAIIVLLFLVLLGCLLLPKIKVAAELSESVIVVALTTLLFDLRYNAKSENLAIRVVFYRWITNMGGDDEQDYEAPKLMPEKSKPTIRVSFERPSSSASKTKTERSSKSAKKIAKPKGSNDFGRKLWAERTLFVDIIKRTSKMLFRLLTSVRIDRWTSHLTVATADPMITGILFGCLAPLNALSRPPNHSLTFDIDFDEILPTGELNCVFSTRLIILLFVLFVHIVRMPWFRIYRLYRHSRKRSIPMEGAHAVA